MTVKTGVVSAGISHVSISRQPTRNTKARISPAMRASLACRSGSFDPINEMNRTLSMPRTTSIAVRVRSAIQPEGCVTPVE